LTNEDDLCVDIFPSYETTTKTFRTKKIQIYGVIYVQRGIDVF